MFKIPPNPHPTTLKFCQQTLYYNIVVPIGLLLTQNHCNVTLKYALPNKMSLTERLIKICTTF